MKAAISTFALLTLLVLLTLIVATIPAPAQNAPYMRSYYNPIGHWEDDDHPSLRRYVRHARHTRKVWRHHRHYDGCQSSLSVVGDQYATKDGAKQEADKAWMQTARWKYGERFMDRQNADNIDYECGRSSVGSVAGQVFYRCSLKARPCPANEK